MCQRIADVLSELLCAVDVNVLRNTVCSIRSLGEAGLCQKELLSDTLLVRIADIVVRYQEDLVLVRDCCAVLAVFSYDYQSHRCVLQSIWSVICLSGSLNICIADHYEIVSIFTFSLTYVLYILCNIFIKVDTQSLCVSAPYW